MTAISPASRPGLGRGKGRRPIAGFIAVRSAGEKRTARFAVDIGLMNVHYNLYYAP